MSDVVRRLASDDPNDREAWAGTGTVVNAAAGTGSDGRKYIRIEWRGTQTDCTYGSWYSPTVGDAVVFIKDGPSIFVLGDPAT